MESVIFMLVVFCLVLGSQADHQKLANYILAIDTFHGDGQGRMDFATSVRVLAEWDGGITEDLKREVLLLKSVCEFKASKCSKVLSDITEMTMQFRDRNHVIPYLKNCLERQVGFCADVAD